MTGAQASGAELRAEDAFGLVAARWERDAEPFNDAELAVVRVWWLERTAEERLAPGAAPCPRWWVDAVDRVSSEGDWDAFAEDVEGWLALVRSLPTNLTAAADLLREANGGELSSAARNFVGEHVGAYEELVCGIVAGIAGFACEGRDALRLRPGRGEVRWVDGEPWVRPRAYRWERLGGPAPAPSRRRTALDRELDLTEVLLGDQDDDQDDDGPSRP
ncbi:hypothetical protein [Streptomyces griseoaurantiacus]|uniref:hypothetical protein n=1 Tax=Streptomyces griseoaurantiacus TaxID=68213 RepID=UPI002E28DB9D|nr:hypothetical protein [Streptomyces jietaisiensis]